MRVLLETENLSCESFKEKERRFIIVKLNVEERCIIGLAVQLLDSEMEARLGLFKMKTMSNKIHFIL